MWHSISLLQQWLRCYQSNSKTFPWATVRTSKTHSWPTSSAHPRSTMQVRVSRSSSPSCASCRGSKPSVGRMISCFARLWMMSFKSFSRSVVCVSRVGGLYMSHRVHVYLYARLCLLICCIHIYVSMYTCVGEGMWVRVRVSVRVCMGGCVCLCECVCGWVVAVRESNVW